MSLKVWKRTDSMDLVKGEGCHALAGWKGPHSSILDDAQLMQRRIIVGHYMTTINQMHFRKRMWKPCQLSLDELHRLRLEDVNFNPSRRHPCRICSTDAQLHDSRRWRDDSATWTCKRVTRDA